MYTSVTLNKFGDIVNNNTMDTKIESSCLQLSLKAVKFLFNPAVVFTKVSIILLVFFRAVGGNSLWVEKNLLVLEPSKYLYFYKES